MKRIENRNQRTIRIGQGFVVPEADHPVALRLDPIRPIRAIVGVLPTVHLDDQLCFGTKEIGNIRADRMLPAKPETIQLLAAQARPETQFPVGRVLP